jgi:hypothetical protein
VLLQFRGLDEQICLAAPDHRADLKQLVWILTVTADGAVPIAFRVADGNTADVTLHVDTWDALVVLTGEVGFFASRTPSSQPSTTADTSTRGGRFLSVLPASRREDGVFRDCVVTNAPDWDEIARRPTREAEHPEDVVSAYEDHLPSADGHRITWIHSTAKARRDAHRRHEDQAIARAIAAIDALNSRLASPRCRIKTAVAAEAEAREHLAELNATRWVTIHVETDTSESFRQPNGAVPAPTPPTRRSSPPGCGSGSPSTRPALPTTPPPTGCGRCSPTTPT